ncbi:MAG TPA: LysM peptidoglycan-binding domain-containing protein [Draconibacterium sp.]|nr:LysM peptidoglycan-binding domain-containing protein [Draconibacterium sp.]
MKYILNILFFFLLIILAEHSHAQNQQDKIVTEDSRQYILHQIRTGETIFSLTKKYKMDRSELERLNPGLAKGPSIGDVIKIPFDTSIDLSTNNDQKRKNPDGFINYKIKSKNETAYFIAKQYDITVEELYDYNPSIKRLKKGTSLQIPFWNKQNQTTQNVSSGSDQSSAQGEKIVEHRVASGETLYSLTKRYNITEAEILHLNPDAVNLKAGQILRIPQKGEQLTAVAAPRSSVSSGKYFEHIIESGETLWGTTRRYGVSEEELKALNPILNTGFPAGAVIKIPVKDDEIDVLDVVNDDSFEKHEVQRGETLYGISSKYHVSVLDLKKFNPVLDHRNLVAGETILVPTIQEENRVESDTNNATEFVSQPAETVKEEYYKVEVPMEIPESCQPDQSGIYKHQTYDIALFLPLYLEANDTLNREDVVDTLLPENTNTDLLSDIQDTTIEVERKELFKKFYGNTENFIQFYEGVLLSIEDMKNQGVKVDLHVFDTQHNANFIRQFINDPSFLETDLIIGPIYPDVQSEVSQIAAKNRIPIVSPLASQSSLINSNPYYFQVNPSRDYLAAETADMVAEEYYNSNFIILKTQDYSNTPEGKIVTLLQEKFVNAGLMSERNGVNFTIYDFKAEGPFGLRRIMSKSKENVVYIPSSDEGSLSIAISNVNNLASEYSITLIGANRFPNYQSIQLDHYYNLKLKYIAPYWTDYSAPATIRFIQRFKDNFGTEPDNFGMQGYDVTSYFMEALLAYGKDFASCLPYFHVPLIQGTYHFEKYSQLGGYINQGVSVIEYTRNYEVKRDRVKGVPRFVIAER